MTFKDILLKKENVETLKEATNNYIKIGDDICGDEGCKCICGHNIRHLSIYQHKFNNNQDVMILGGGCNRTMIKNKVEKANPDTFKNFIINKKNKTKLNKLNYIELCKDFNFLKVDLCQCGNILKYNYKDCHKCIMKKKKKCLHCKKKFERKNIFDMFCLDCYKEFQYYKKNNISYEVGQYEQKIEVCYICKNETKNKLLCGKCNIEKNKYFKLFEPRTDKYKKYRNVHL